MILDKLDGRNLEEFPVVIFGSGPAGITIALELEKNNSSKLKQKNWLKLMKRATNIKEEVFPVKGRDLIDRGIPEGPQVSDILKNLEDWWVKNGCKADKVACLKRL